ADLNFTSRGVGGLELVEPPAVLFMLPCFCEAPVCGNVGGDGMRLANGRVAGKQYIGTEGLLILGRTELVARDELVAREAGECVGDAEHVRPQREGQFRSEEHTSEL